MSAPIENVIDQLKMSRVPQAKVILETALKAISTRGDEHGDLEESFTMIAKLWETYIGNVMVVRGQHRLDGRDVAQMLLMLKIARAVYGTGMDHYVDEAGYAAIAAALCGEEPEAKT